MTFEKLKFAAEFDRVENGERLYLIADESQDRVYAYRLFREADKDQILSLVQRAYDAGAKDMQDHVCKSMDMKESIYGGFK
jgi:hypothetical protein